MINQWLNYKERISNPYRTFKIIDVSEKDTPDSDIKTYLGEEVLRSYRDIDP